MTTRRTVLELALRGSQPELIDEVVVEGCVVTVKGPGPWLLASAGPTTAIWTIAVDDAAPRGSGGRRAGSPPASCCSARTTG